MSMIIDTHAHYDDHAFDQDRKELLSGLLERSVANIINASAAARTIPKVLALAEYYNFVYAMAGLHPCEVYGCGDNTGSHVMEVYGRETEARADIEWVQTYNIIKIQEWLGEAFAAYDPDEIITSEWTASEREMRLLRTVLSHPKVVAVGEIGLDYHYDDTNKPLQKKWFADQINLAREFDKPVNIHSRDAAADTADIMKAEHARDVGGIVHCFSYGREMAAEFLDMGFMLGIGGVVTFKNSRKIKEVVSYMPLDMLVLETDCPYLAPSPYRGKRNDSGYISYTAQAIADIKGVTAESMMEIAAQNARRVYKLG